MKIEDVPKNWADEEPVAQVADKQLPVVVVWDLLPSSGICVQGAAKFGPFVLNTAHVLVVQIFAQSRLCEVTIPLISGLAFHPTVAVALIRGAFAADQWRVCGGARLGHGHVSDGIHLSNLDNLSS